MASREEKKAATRKKLLDAAASLVAREGALAASLDRIAEKAGLTKGAVYSNFASKEDLILTLAREAALVVDGEAIFERPARPIGDVLAEMGEAIAAELGRARATTWLLTFEILTFALHNSRIRRAIAETFRDTFDEDADWFDRVRAEMGETGSLTGSEMAVLTQSLAVGMALTRAIDPDSVPDDLFPKAFRLLAG